MDYRARMEAFRAGLAAAEGLAGPEGLDAYWLPKAENIRYLTGFPGKDSSLLVTRERTVLVTDSRYAEQAQAEAAVDEVISRQRSMAEAVSGQCRALGVQRVGLTAANMSHAAYLALAAAAAPEVELVSRRAGIAERMRLCKDPEEVEAIRRALATAEAGFRAAVGHVEPGRTEKWLAARLDYEMRVAGADEAAFDTICAVGARASVPHAEPGEAPVTAGGTVLFDWGARLDGYSSDLTRLVCLGTIPPDWQGLLEIVLEAQKVVIDRLRPGIRCAEADAAGRAVIAGAGYGDNFGHGIGHGVGLEVHEGPRLAPGDETVLMPGMVVTVEPGIYLPGEAGVRMEEMVLIAADGHEVLTKLPQRSEELLSWRG